MAVPQFVTQFANFALSRGIREALRLADVLPEPTAVRVVTRGEAEIVGACVYFEAPVKPVWMQPAGGESEGMKVEMGATEFTRQKQGDITTDTFWVFYLEDDGTIQDTAQRFDP